MKVYAAIMFLMLVSVHAMAFTIGYSTEHGTVTWTNDPSNGPVRYAVRWSNDLIESNGWRCNGPGSDIVTTNTIVSAPMALYYSVIEVPEDGLVAYYRFVYNADDYSTNQLHGTLERGTELAQGRTVEEAACYSAAHTNYVLCGTNELLNLGLTNEFSICLWFRMDSVDHYSGNFLGKTVIPYDGTGYNVGFFPGLGPYLSVGGNTTYSKSLLSPGTSQWYHLVFTYDQPLASIYIDGKRDKQKSDNSYHYTPSDEPLLLGNTSTNGTYGFQGSLKNIRLYNRALDSNEVQAIYDYEYR